jgi:hypothetical protein
VDDDDAVIVPAPPVEYLAHSTPRPQLAKHQRLESRRTLIPVLFTLGGCLIAIGACKWLCNPATPLGQQPTWMAIGLFVIAGISLLLSLLNALHVGHDLKAATKQ